MKEGDKAIDFELKDKDSNIHSLDKIKSDFIVLYFYPKDSTPGCTIEAKEFSDLINEFKKLKAEIIGVSGGDEKSKEKFCEKNHLKIILLSDPEFKVCKKYEVYGEKQFMGRKFLGIKRTSFLIDKNMKIVKRWENVKSKGHAGEVLIYIESINKK